jgi:hypothetical protein
MCACGQILPAPGPPAPRHAHTHAHARSDAPNRPPLHTNGRSLHAITREQSPQSSLSNMSIYPPSTDLPGDLRPCGAARWSAAFSDVSWRGQGEWLCGACVGASVVGGWRAAALVAPAGASACIRRPQGWHWRFSTAPPTMHAPARNSRPSPLCATRRRRPYCSLLLPLPRPAAHSA